MKITANDIIRPGDQGSGQWFSQRIGKLTASKMSAAMSFRKDGKPSAEREKLMISLLSERMTDQITDQYDSPAMAWGREYESSAKEQYIQLTGRSIRKCSFFDHPEIDNLGASPDGLIDDDGLIEIKCPTSPTHLRYLLMAEAPEEYWPQMTVQLMCTSRKWCDFATYDPRFPEKNRMKIVRFVPDNEYLEKVSTEAVRFLEELDSLFDQITERTA